MESAGFSYPPENATLTGDDGGSGDDPQVTVSEAFYYILSILGLAMFCFCSRSRRPDDRFLLAAAARTRQWQQREERKDRMTDKDYRIALVLRGLVIRKIVEEKDGFLTLGDCPEDEDDEVSHDQRSAGGSIISIDSMDEKTSTCAICLEPFRVGDVVGLSRTLFQHPDENDKVCNHAFHKECIVGTFSSNADENYANIMFPHPPESRFPYTKAWLMNPTRDECPSCRTVIVEENEDDRERAASRTDKESGSEMTMPEIPEFQPNFAFVIMHGLVSRVRHASNSIIGKSINTKHEDIEAAYLCPDTPPSPFRRVYSHQGFTQPRQRSSVMRRRTSLGSKSPDQEAADNIMLPDDLDNSPEHSTLPSDLRRVVSDFTGIMRPASSLSFEPPRPSRPALSFRPRTTQSNRMAHYDHSERSMCSEDEIVLQQVPPGGALLGEDTRNDVFLDLEIS